jgi:hypothetical protein
MDQQAPETTRKTVEQPLEVTIYQHSMVLYWWPVWLLGLIMAAVTWFGGEHVTIGGQTMWFHPSRNVGIIYLSVVFFVFVVTHMSLKGTVSILILTVGLAAALVFAVLGWWDAVFSLEHHLSIHMDLGFYLIVSLVLFSIWIVSVFVSDRCTYYVFRPGQMIERKIFGGGSRTYDTRGMAVYRIRVDPFRHWTLGFGSGDLHISTSGAERTTFDLQNVMSIDRKLKLIQQLSAMSPEQLSDFAKPAEVPPENPGE